MTALPMHCDQCEQTAHNTACTTKGVCGKTADVESAQKLLLLGVKGLAAYKSHARRLGKSSPELDAFVEDALFSTMTNVSFDLESLLDMVEACGRMSYEALRLLDAAHIECLGVPEVVEVDDGLREGPGILVTGHDLADLLELLEQCEGTGVRVYTHGEMLPAHAYPRLRAYSCLAGHYGNAWQRQRWDFERFGGPVVATTNCVLVPWATNTYLSRLHTTRHTTVPGASRIRDGDFSAVIEQARALGPLEAGPVETRQVGWHYQRVLGEVPRLAEALKTRSLEHIFVIGGCDGAEPGRNYFSKYAQATPASSLVLTMGCGKYRVREHVPGEVEGLPRLLDMGQCNDAFGAMQVALALASATGQRPSELPLTVQLSWFEQKSVAVLLALLHLGLKGVTMGPSFPAFVSSGVLDRLVARYGLRVIGRNPKQDLAEDLALARGAAC
jgi:hydroxylamine reductase